jgi:hypothetical protein
LAKIFKVRDKDGACRQVKRLLKEKLDAMEEQIRDLVAMRDHLRTLLTDWEERLAQTPEGRPARLLENMVVPARLLKPLKARINR